MAEIPASFERDTGITEAEWLRCLLGACGAHPLSLRPPGAALVHIGNGTLSLHWQVMPRRRIALISLPRLWVRYRFDGVDEAARQGFMREFDRYMLRGGG